MSDIKAKGGMPIIATAETVEHLDSTRVSTGYDGEAIVDPRNLLAAELKRRGFLEIAISERKGYEHGMAQPAVLVLTSDDTVLQKWAIIPSAVCSYVPMSLAAMRSVLSTRYAYLTLDESRRCEGSRQSKRDLGEYRSATRRECCKISTPLLDRCTLGAA